MAGRGFSELRVFVLHGPNLNFLGRRDPEIYGRQTLSEIDAQTTDFAARLGLQLDCRQSNSEGTLIDWVQEASAIGALGIIINAAGYSHTSIALADAVRDFSGHTVEVHLSNIFKRESFRQHSWMSGAVDGVVVGFGAEGYLLAVRVIAQRLEEEKLRRGSRLRKGSREGSRKG
ncbi:MAG: type II 3-dehydroquinate dehydratase [Alphaproteobacteria bacterium]